MSAVSARQVSPAIRISLTGLTKYMDGTQSRQRKTLKDYKYPDPEGKAQRDYYSEARKTIKAYHRQGKPEQWLLDQASLLRSQGRAQGGQRETKLKHNARALQSYAKHFSERDYVLLSSPKLSLVFGQVRISVFPDLCVEEGKKVRLIRLGFHKEPSSDDAMRIACQVMFEASEQAGLGLPSSCILYHELSNGAVRKGARMGARMRAEIEAACQNIAAIWGSI